MGTATKQVSSDGSAPVPAVRAVAQRLLTARGVAIVVGVTLALVKGVPILFELLARPDALPETYRVAWDRAIAVRADSPEASAYRGPAAVQTWTVRFLRTGDSATVSVKYETFGSRPCEPAFRLEFFRGGQRFACTEGLGTAVAQPHAETIKERRLAIPVSAHQLANARFRIRVSAMFTASRSWPDVWKELRAALWDMIAGAEPSDPYWGCARNLKQVSMAMWMYYGDYGELRHEALDDLAPLYLTRRQAFRCPERRRPHPSGFDYVYLPAARFGPVCSDDFPVLCERPGNHPSGEVHVLFWDGRIRRHDQRWLESTHVIPEWYRNRRPPPDDEVAWCLSKASTGQGHRRWVALYGLALRRDPRALPHMLDLVLGQPLLWYLPIYGTSLFLLFGEDAVPPLIAALNGVPGREERCKIAMVLGEMRDSRSAGAIIALLESQDEETTRVACEALGKIGGRDAVSALCRLLERDRRTPRYYETWPVAAALRKLGDPSAAPHLCYHAAIGTSEATAALHEMGTAETLGSLCLLLRQDAQHAARSLSWGERKPADIRLVPALIWFLRERAGDAGWWAVRDCTGLLRRGAARGEVARESNWGQVRKDWIEWWDGEGRLWWLAQLKTALPAEAPDDWLRFGSDDERFWLSFLSPDAPPCLQIGAMNLLRREADARARAFLEQAAQDTRWPLREAARLALDRVWK